MCTTPKGLGADVGEVVVRGNLPGLHVAAQNLLTNEIVAQLNVLHASMKHRITNKMHGARIVTKHNRTTLRKTDIMQ